MEEWIGLQWHRWVTRQAEGVATAPHVAHLSEQRRAVELLLQAGGRPLRVAEAAPVRVGGARTRWQRLAGSGLKLPLPQVDGEVLALPAHMAFFDEAELNRDCYLWWAALATVLDLQRPWAEANAEAVPLAWARFPGLQARARRLFDAEAARGGQPWPAAGAEPQAHAPVWSWLRPVPAGQVSAVNASGADEEKARAAATAAAERLRQRRRAQRAAEEASRPAILLAAKGESIRTFCDPLAMDRADDDEDDGSAATAAEELDELRLARRGGSASARVRFDLDLPSASADDAPTGPGFSLPEWDHRTQTLRPDRVRAQPLLPREPVPWTPPSALRAEAARVRRRLEGQRAALRWRPGQSDGEEMDLDAWVRWRGEPGGASGLYRRRSPEQRELATLLLADLSLSTDAYANEQQRVIEVIRDALFVFGEALAASGDAFAITGFSSVRRQLRLHPVKRFDERWGTATLPRLGALKPGYYTRMGAALRAATRELSARPERRKLLLLLTDGKPHDLDGYDGRAGLEDTRQAVLEARRAGLLPFAISIEAEAGETLPLLFGSTGGLGGAGGWAALRRPEELPQRLGALYAQLVR